MSERKYRRVELATPLWEAWIYDDGSVSIGEVIFIYGMGHGGPSIHLHAEDVAALMSALAAIPTPRQLRDSANGPWSVCGVCGKDGWCGTHNDRNLDDPDDD